jgi:hypothetical protein
MLVAMILGGLAGDCVKVEDVHGTMFERTYTNHIRFNIDGLRTTP